MCEKVNVNAQPHWLAIKGSKEEKHLTRIPNAGHAVGTHLHGFKRGTPSSTSSKPCFATEACTSKMGSAKIAVVHLIAGGPCVT